ncbi:MAG: hypothetical protein NTU67_12525 [Gemmatimonadetes bacterium]|nr:hypothetical protein [Gemmatimonadota bacterium]
MRLSRSLVLCSMVGVLAACSSSSPTAVTPAPPVSTRFSIQVIFLSTPSAAFQLAMDSVVKRLTAIVTAGPAGYPISMSAADAASYTTTIRKTTANGGCGLGNATLPSGAYPGIVIFAQDTATLGSAQIIAQAGPCLVRTGGLPIVASMRFRTDYLAPLATNNQLVDVMTHEMLHTLGFNSTIFGTRPDSINPLITGAGTNTTAFRGSNAKIACLTFSPTVSATCSPTIPLENTGGSGTADDHWRESIFKTELMTGTIEARGVKMPLSAMTIGSLADMGYTVTASLAEPYTLPVGSSPLMNLLAGDAPANSGTPIPEIITRAVAVFRPGQKP